MLPPVVVGLFVYLMLSRSGPLGSLGWLFTPAAMVAAQTILTIPIVMSLSLRACQPLGAVVGLDRQALDLTDPQAIRRVLREAKPDVILNPAAYTAVDQAEQDEHTATAINGDAVAVMAEEAARLNALFVHYSTDYVFDGCKDGACGSCKCKKLSGTVVHGPHQEKALSAAEEAQGGLVSDRRPLVGSSCSAELSTVHIVLPLRYLRRCRL